MKENLSKLVATVTKLFKSKLGMAVLGGVSVIVGQYLTDKPVNVDAAVKESCTKLGCDCSTVPDAGME